MSIKSAFEQTFKRKQNPDTIHLVNKVDINTYIHILEPWLTPSKQALLMLCDFLKNLKAKTPETN